MHKLEKLKENLIAALEEYADETVNGNTLPAIDKLAHATKNVCKIIETCDGEYSERGYARHYYDGESGRYYRDGESNYYRDGDQSGARGRRYAKRDSMGRYSRSDELRSKLHNLMNDTNDENDRHKIMQLMDRLDGME